MDLLSQLRLSLLDGGHDHVADTAGGQAVQAGTDTLDGDDVQVAGTRVVGAVHDGTDGETQGHLELATGGTTTAVTRLVSPRRSLETFGLRGPAIVFCGSSTRIMNTGAGMTMARAPFLSRIRGRSVCEIESPMKTLAKSR